MLLLACLPALASVSSMVGRWRASGGWIVTIPPSPTTFDLVFENAQGERVVHPARWVTAGLEMSWTDKANNIHTATLDPRNPDRIKDVNAAYPSSPAYWYREK
jgi:hypothetical protein